MKEILSTKVQNNFGEMLATAKTEPIAILKYKQPVAVLVSYDYFKRLVQQDESYWIKQAGDAEKGGLLEFSDYVAWLNKRYAGKPNSHVKFIRLTHSVLAYFDTVKNETFEKMIKHVRRIQTDENDCRLAATSDYCMCRYKSRYIVFKYLQYDAVEDDGTGILCVVYVSDNYAG